MPTELADNATHQEIQAYIDEVMQEEQSGEKSDAQLIAEEHEDTPIAEVNTGDQDTAEHGEEAGDSESWLDDDLKAEVAAYGIGEDELADFTSREELDRALRLFDKTALEAGRKAMAENEEPKELPDRDDKGRFTKPKEGEHEIGLSDIWDEEIKGELIGELTKLRDHYESRLDALETRFAEADAKAEEQYFDGLVDSLGHADLFGTTGKENSKQLERRQDLHVAVKAQQIGLEMLGRPVDLDKSLVNRVARMVFADELGKKDWKAKTTKISKQGNGRMGGGSSKSPEVPESIEEWADRYYKELEGT